MLYWWICTLPFVAVACCASSPSLISWVDVGSVTLSILYGNSYTIQPPEYLWWYSQLMMMVLGPDLMNLHASFADNQTVLRPSLQIALWRSFLVELLPSFLIASALYSYVRYLRLVPGQEWIRFMNKHHRRCVSLFVVVTPSVGFFCSMKMVKEVSILSAMWMHCTPFNDD